MPVHIVAPNPILPSADFAHLGNGVQNFNVSLEKQKVHVEAEPELKFDMVLQKIKNTGKKVTAGWENGEERDVEKATV